MAENLCTFPRFTQNYQFCRLQLVAETFGHSTNEETYQNSIKVPKNVKQPNKESLLKDFVN